MPLRRGIAAHFAGPLGCVAYFAINLMQHLTYLPSKFSFQPPIHAFNALRAPLGSAKNQRMDLEASPVGSGPQ
ncbi:hypothetical protein CS8_023310 [Cupriavidus sp. 8B]